LSGRVTRLQAFPDGGGRCHLKHIADPDGDGVVSVAGAVAEMLFLPRSEITTPERWSSDIKAILKHTSDDQRVRHWVNLAIDLLQTPQVKVAVHQLADVLEICRDLSGDEVHQIVGDLAEI
jgi:hypothetical protein